MEIIAKANVMIITIIAVMKFSRMKILFLVYVLCLIFNDNR